MVINTAGARNPLEPVDTSSPRATLQSFLRNAEEVELRYSEYRDVPSSATQAALRRTVGKGWRLLDLSRIPEAARREVGGDTLLLLREVIYRLELPDQAEIPGASEIKQIDEDSEPLAKWQIPGTEITIARVEEGSRKGEYLFSPDTVDRAREFYELTRDLPYKRPAPEGDLVRAGQLFTGWMIPHPWIEALPNWTKVTFLGQVIWKWIAVLVLLATGVSIVMVIFLWSRRGGKDSSLLSYVRRVSTPLAILVIALLLRYVFRSQINVSGPAAQLPDYFIQVVLGVAIVWLICVSMGQNARRILEEAVIAPDYIGDLAIRIFGPKHGIDLQLPQRTPHESMDLTE